MIWSMEANIGKYETEIQEKIFTQQNYYYSYRIVACSSLTVPPKLAARAPHAWPMCTHNEVLMVYHQLLVCHAGNFIVQLNVSPCDGEPLYRVFML